MIFEKKNLLSSLSYYSESLSKEDHQSVKTREFCLEDDWLTFPRGLVCGVRVDSPDHSAEGRFGAR